MIKKKIAVHLLDGHDCMQNKAKTSLERAKRLEEEIRKFIEIWSE